MVHIRHPVAHGFVERVFQGFAARFDGHHGGAQQLHAKDVGALALHIFGTHVHDALQPIARADGGRGHAVLASAGLGNDAWLAHAPCQHGLADDVVDLVRTGVVEVFTLQEDLCAADFFAQALGVVHGGGAANKMRQLALVFGLKFGVVLVTGPGIAQLLEGKGQGFAGKAAAVGAKVAGSVGVVVVKHAMSTLRGTLGRPYGGDKLLHFGGIFDAFKRAAIGRGGFHAGADINGQRAAARAQQAHAIGHVCRCESTR